MKVFELKPSEWSSPAMDTEFARGVKKKLEDYYGRPMFGKIALVEPESGKPGIEIEYADPKAVVELIMKLEKCSKQEDEGVSKLKEIYKIGKGHS